MCVLKMWLVLDNSGAGKTSKCVWRQGLYVNVSSWRLTDPRLLKQPKICRAMVLILVNLYRSISLYRVRTSVRGWWGYLCRRWALLSTAEKFGFFSFFLYPVSRLFSSNVDNRLEQQPNCVWNNIKVVVQNSPVKKKISYIDVRARTVRGKT